MKIEFIIGIILIASIGIFISCKGKKKTDSEIFQEVLNDSRINSREVGEREGIKFFQVMENEKYGFRDLDGNIVIEPSFDMAEMFSEGYSAVTVGEKHGFIDEKGKYVLPLQDYEFLGSLHNGLADVRINDKVGFINIKGEIVIEPQFDWADEFSEGFCIVRNDNEELGSGKSEFINTKGEKVFKKKFDYASKFENGKAKVEFEKEWFFIDTNGEIIEKIK
jgi:hypothetical protein